MRLLVPLFITALTSVSFGCFLIETPEQTLDKYYKHHAPDYEGMDPLILAGERVVPLVMEKVADRGMVKRGGAINFLGNGSYRQAVPVLEKILADESEHEIDRSLALIAIFKIDRELGRGHAEKYRNHLGDVRKTANEILRNEEYLHYRRTYWDALTGRHD